MALLSNLLNSAAVAVDSLAKSASSGLNTVSETGKEYEKIKALEKSIMAINTELDAAYLDIGKRYFSYIMEHGNDPFTPTIHDVLQSMEPKLERKIELETEKAEVEKRVQDMVILQEKAKLKNEVEAEITKLKSAKQMGVLTDEEYEKKVLQAQSKIHHFDEIRRQKKLREMGIDISDL